MGFLGDVASNIGSISTAINPVTALPNLVTGGRLSNAMGNVGRTIGDKVQGAVTGINPNSGANAGNANFNMGSSQNRDAEIAAMLARYRLGGQGQSSQYIDPQAQAVQATQRLANQVSLDPTVTNQQVANAQNQNLANAYALAASQRGGGNPALAQRAAMDQIASGNQSILNQSLPAALQERQQNIQTAAGLQKSVGDMSSQGRNQDLQFEQMANQFALQYMQMGLSEDLARAQGQLDASRINLGASQAAQARSDQMMGGIFNAGAGIMSAGLLSKAKTGTQDNLAQNNSQNNIVDLPGMSDGYSYSGQNNSINLRTS